VGAPARCVQSMVAMGLREFEDTSGERWRVWDTVPDRAESLGEFRLGWLTFDNGTERRRLAPIPVGWSELPDTRLSILLRLAAGSTTREPRPEPHITGDPEERRRAERRKGDRRVNNGRRPPS